MTNEEVLKQIDEAQDIVRAVSMRLKTLADAFYTTGNMEMRNKLQELKEGLQKSTQKTHEAMSALVANLVQHATDAERATLNAIIKGVIQNPHAKGPT
jgi:small-conductance mechanosensitive channel